MGYKTFLSSLPNDGNNNLPSNDVDSKSSSTSDEYGKLSYDFNSMLKNLFSMDFFSISLHFKLHSPGNRCKFWLG